MDHAKNVCAIGVMALAMACCLCAGATERAWTAQWIGTGMCLGDWRKPVLPAPVFRKVFTLEAELRRPRLAVTGLGYFDCRIDGRPVSDGLLMPTPTQYDVRWRYRVFDLPPLKPGRHVLSIAVGDGLYRPSTRDTWHFDKATWMAYPKAICELADADVGRLVVKSDQTWETRDSPIMFNSLRGGEVYDARREFDVCETDASCWRPVDIVPPPGGVGEEEAFPLCRITRVHPMVRRSESMVWSAPVTLTGNVRIRVRGTSGSKVTLLSSEVLTPDGRHADMEKAGCFLDYGEESKTSQRDVYILRGGGTEVWAPRFTYHGFRHVEAVIEGEAEVLSLEALEIGTDFPRHASFSASDGRLGRVAALCDQSIRSNMTGMPTDCPAREKNGWSCDARTFSEAALYAFEAGSVLGTYCDVLGDTQRPSGQLSGIAPCSGWGYNWGGCPPWDSALFFIPESVLAFTGDDSVARRLYPKMLRNVDYVESILDASGVPAVGIGDWLAPVAPGKELYQWPWREMSAAFRVGNVMCAERLARRFGFADDALRFERVRRRAVMDFQRNFCDAAGLPVFETSTLHALALAFDLVRPECRSACAGKMAELLRVRNHRVDFGIIGVGFVIRMLFENGYVDDAYRVMTQPEKPGFVYLSDTLNLTAMPERWDIDERPDCHESSFNHAYMSEYLACIYRYLAGFRHDRERPGVNYLEIRPSIPKELDWFKAKYLGFCVEWARDGEDVRMTVTVPPGKSACCVTPSGERREVSAGIWRF